MGGCSRRIVSLFELCIKILLRNEEGGVGRERKGRKRREIGKGRGNGKEKKIKER